MNDWKPSRYITRTAHYADYLSDLTGISPVEAFFLVRHLDENQWDEVRRIANRIKRGQQ